MMEKKRLPRRIGMIVPSSNTVVEPICSRLFAGMEAQITVHYARLEVINVSLDEGSARQFTSDAIGSRGHAAGPGKCRCHRMEWYGRKLAWD